MEQSINEILGGLIIVTGFVVITYFIARYTYLIRKMLVEKGISREKSGQGITKKDVAYVVVGLGVGLLITGGLSLLDFEENTLDLLGWGVVLISGAVGLMIASKSKQ